MTNQEINIDTALKGIDSAMKLQKSQKFQDDFHGGVSKIPQIRQDERMATTSINFGGRYDDCAPMSGENQQVLENDKFINDQLLQLIPEAKQ